MTDQPAEQPSRPAPWLDTLYPLPEWVDIALSNRGTAILALLGAIKLERDETFGLIRAMHSFTAKGYLDACHRLRVDARNSVGEQSEADDVIAAPTHDWSFIDWMVRNGVDALDPQTKSLDELRDRSTELAEVGYRWLLAVVQFLVQDIRETRNKMVTGQTL